MENKGNRSHSYVLLLLFLILALTLFFRNIFTSLSSKYKYTDPVVSTVNERGNIYDRRGNLLAFDREELGFSITNTDSSQLIAYTLAPYTDYSTLALTNLIENSAPFIPLSRDKRFDLNEIKTAVENAGLGQSVTITSSTSRFYPHSYFTSILGEAYSSFKAEGGVEEKFNSYLAAIPKLGEKENKGESIVLTLDMTLEELLYSLLSSSESTIDVAILNGKSEILAYYGTISDELLSNITYSHSTVSETTLFLRDEYISLDECTPLSSYYIYMSQEDTNALESIEKAMREKGLIY